MDEETAKELLNETKDAIAEKIIASTDPEAIHRMFETVKWIDEGTANWLQNETS